MPFMLGYPPFPQPITTTDEPQSKMAGSPILVLDIVDLNDSESSSKRTLILRAPDYECEIGRGSRSGAEDLFPSHTNGLFESRVMSRKHARITADPISREVLVSDLDSMHGTKLNGKHLVPMTQHSLRLDDQLKFGADVVRHEDTFPALEINVNSLNWFEDACDVPSSFAPLQPPPTRTFAVPEYSEDDFDDVYDSELEYLGKSAADRPSVEVVIPPFRARSSSVPESAGSDEESIAYDEDRDGTNTSPSIGEELHDGEKQPDMDQMPTSQILLETTTTLTEATATIDNLQTALTSTPQPQTDDHYITESERSAESGDDYSKEEHAESAPADAEHYRPSRLLSKVSAEVGSTEVYRAPSPSDAAMARPPMSATSQDFYSYTPCSNFPSYVGAGSVLPSFDSFPNALSMHQSTYLQQFPLYDYDSITPTSNMLADRLRPVPIQEQSIELKRKRTEDSPYQFAKAATKPSLDHTTVMENGHKTPDSNPLATDGETSTLFKKKETVPLKRKADVMSNEEDDVVGGNAMSALPETEDEASTTLRSVEKTDRLRASKTEGEMSVEPPAKRVKRSMRVRGTTQQQGRGETMKYVATALAGVAVGAIGTIWGLVALPEDFFA